VIVDFEDLAAEGGRAAVFEFILSDFGGEKRNCWFCGSLKQNRRMVREVAGNEGFTHFLAIPGDSDEELEPVGESCDDLAMSETRISRRISVFRRLRGPARNRLLPDSGRGDPVVLVVVFADD
jgi:hypothetical protein